MKYFRLLQTRDDSSDYWYMNMKIHGYQDWELRMGNELDLDKCDMDAYLFSGRVEVDYPATSTHTPIVSTHLREIWESVGVTSVQYLPISVQIDADQKITGKYYVVNFLNIIDCLDREHSTYKVWTKENLLYWEKREWMLGTFRDVRHAVLDNGRIHDALAFRLWGWEVMLIVREDLKEACEKADIKGCVFKEIPTI